MLQTDPPIDGISGAEAAEILGIRICRDHFVVSVAGAVQPDAHMKLN
jgi:hypothetical protein